MSRRPSLHTISLKSNLNVLKYFVNGRTDIQINEDNQINPCQMHAKRWVGLISYGYQSRTKRVGNISTEARSAEVDIFRPARSEIDIHRQSTLSRPAACASLINPFTHHINALVHNQISRTMHSVHLVELVICPVTEALGSLKQILKPFATTILSDFHTI